MSLTSNNTELQNILAAVNALPEAGSGGGSSGGGVETCTVTLMGEYPAGRPLHYIWTTIDSSGNLTCATVFNNTSQSVTITDVVCGSMLIYSPYGGMYNRSYETSNAEILVHGTTSGFDLVSCFKIVAAAGETATITAKYSETGGSN